ncbi:hypothetical protein Tco_0111503 [Tanacetum coccineum]
MVQNLRAQDKELQSENEHLKSKVVDFTTVQNLQVQVEELKSVNKSLNLLVKEVPPSPSLNILETVSNKAGGRIWLCHSPEFGWSNLRIRKDRPVIR